MKEFGCLLKELNWIAYYSMCSCASQSLQPEWVQVPWVHSSTHGHWKPLQTVHNGVQLEPGHIPSTRARLQEGPTPESPKENVPLRWYPIGTDPHSTWMSLRNRMLGERKQVQKSTHPTVLFIWNDQSTHHAVPFMGNAQSTHHTVPFMWNAQDGQIHRDRMRIKVVARCWGREKGEWAVAPEACGVSFGGDESVLESGSGDSCIILLPH